MNTVQPVTTDVETHVDATPAQFTRFDVIDFLIDTARKLDLPFPGVSFNRDITFALRADSLAELEAWMEVFDLKPEPDGNYWGHRHATLPILMYQTAADYKRWHGWCVSATGAQEIDVTSDGAL